MDIYMGAVMSFGFNFAPKGWATCSGQLLPISTNQALFSLLGTTYGGNGQTTFGLPNLQGRTIIGQGIDTSSMSWTMGQMAGTTSTTLLISNIPSHTHTTATAIKIPVLADTAAGTDPTDNVFAITTGGSAYSNVAANATLRPFQENMVVGIAGGSQPFNNMSPFQVINYSIALQGIFPSRN